MGSMNVIVLKDGDVLSISDVLQAIAEYTLSLVKNAGDVKTLDIQFEGGGRGKHYHFENVELDTSQTEYPTEPTARHMDDLIIVVPGLSFQNPPTDDESFLINELAETIFQNISSVYFVGQEQKEVNVSTFVHEDFGLFVALKGVKEMIELVVLKTVEQSKMLENLNTPVGK